MLRYAAVATKKIDSKCGDKLRDAGFSQLETTCVLRSLSPDWPDLV